ncbi:hypothetical protein GCM10010404_63960 [Nonomuraea africana]|uniref:Uncharacterized protein n=1 Tax=Nonomuraea africana TaxID=46171 RepID=A0ABR9KGS3_9ACTN|nr:hypothetical protein [Nonomuraea africana]MBE1561214.1 hypothetical protein [Nonomuraea africana]
MDERRHVKDELQVPPQRIEDQRDDPDATDDRTDRDFQATAESRSEHGQTWEGQTRDDRIQDERIQGYQTQGDQTRDEQAREQAWQEPQQVSGAEPDARYRDPYDRTGDVLVAGVTDPGQTDPGTQPMAGPTPEPRDEQGAEATTADSTGEPTTEPGEPTTEPTEPAAETAETGEPAGSTEGQTAPAKSEHLLDQDPEQVRNRWRELQGSFVDEPRESVERADRLVEELVSTLTSRTTELRDRWKNAGEGDTEQLRLALRDYRVMLDQLLTLGSGER